MLVVQHTSPESPRTAAVNFRSRVIGVVLTGLLGDGAAGLLAVHRCGGLTLMQAPDDAAYDDMPRRALDVVKDARKFAMDDLGKLLVRACSEPAPEPPPVPEALLEESLWVALQTLEERAQMLELLAGDDRQRGWHRTADGYVQRASETRVHAERLRELLLHTPV